MGVQNFDPSNYLQVTTLRVIEIGLMFALYKRDLLSMAGITDYFKNCIDIGLGFVIALAGFVIFFTLLALDFTPYLKHFIPEQQTSVPSKQIFLFIISGGLIAPLAEELFFRACLINLIPKKTTLIQALPNLIIIACIFVLPHIDFNSANADISFLSHVGSQMLNIFIWGSCSVLTICTTLWRKSILTGWVIHCMANITLYAMQNGLLKV